MLLNDVLPAEYSDRRDNRGFEGIALSEDGRTLYAIMQNPLATGLPANVLPYPTPGGTASHGGTWLVE